MKSLLVLGVLALLLTGGFLFILSFPSEPSYQGKTLTEWLESRGTNNVAQAYEAEAAVKAMGTNAVPALVRMLRRGNSPLDELLALVSKQHVVPVHYVTAEQWHLRGIVGLAYLGPKAVGAVPDLATFIERTHETNSLSGACQVIFLLGPIAKPAVPALLTLAQDKQDANYRHCLAARSLGAIHSEPDKVVPALIKLLQEPSTSIQDSAVKALGQFGPEAKMAVPALLNLYTNASQVKLSTFNALLVPATVGEAIWDSLRSIEPAAAATLPQKYPLERRRYF